MVYNLSVCKSAGTASHDAASVVNIKTKGIRAKRNEMIVHMMTLLLIHWRLCVCVVHDAVIITDFYNSATRGPLGPSACTLIIEQCV